MKKERKTQNPSRFIISSHQNEIIEITVQGKMDINSAHFLGDACPYCTTNRCDNGVEQKVCNICYFKYYVFT